MQATIASGHGLGISKPNTLDSIEGTFLYTVSLFGTIANAAIVLTVTFSRKMHQALYLLIGTLAITDLFISIIYIPSYTYFLIQNQADVILQKQTGTNGTALNYCLISRDLFQQMTSVTLSIKALIAIKLYALTFLIKRNYPIFTMPRTFLYIVLAWVINFLILFLPNILEHSSNNFYLDNDVCQSDKIGKTFPISDLEIMAKYDKLYFLLVIAVHSTQVFLILFCFIRIHNVISRGKTVYWQNHSKNAKLAKIHYSNATTTTCLIFTTFCFCWLPIYIVNIIDPTHELIPRPLHHLAMDLLLLKSAINPVIYFHGFRLLRYEMKLLCLCKQGKKDNNSENTSTTTGSQGIPSLQTSSANV